MTHPTSPVTNEPLHHEESDVDIVGVFKFVAYLVGLAASVHLILWLLLGLFMSQARLETIQYPLAVGQDNRVPPEPRLQVDPVHDFDAYRDRQQEQLEGYHWIDKRAGVVRIPIEKAMKSVVERGIPTRPAQDGGQGHESPPSK